MSCNKFCSNYSTWKLFYNELLQYQQLTSHQGIFARSSYVQYLKNFGSEEKDQVPTFYQQERYYNPRKKKQKTFSPKGIQTSQDWIDAAKRKQPDFKPIIVSPGLVQDPYRPRQTERLDMSYNAWKETYKRWVRSYVTYYALGMCQRHIKDFDRQSFKLEALNIYEKIHNAMGRGNLQALHPLVTPDVYANMSSEVQYRRKGGWEYVDWGFTQEPQAKKDVVIKSSGIVGTDQYNMLQNWVQIVLEFKTKQKFAVYDKDKNLLSGNPEETIDVVDYWVFERHFRVNPQHYWRLAARLDMEKVPLANPDQIQDMSPLNIERKLSSGMVMI